MLCRCFEGSWREGAVLSGFGAMYTGSSESGVAASACSSGAHRSSALGRMP